VREDAMSLIAIMFSITFAPIGFLWVMSKLLCALVRWFPTADWEKVILNCVFFFMLLWFLLGAWKAIELVMLM
jgi:hypothetical protein